MGFVKTDIYDLQFNPYKLIGKDWFLLTSGNKSEYNTMTASWGQTGVCLCLQQWYVPIERHLSLLKKMNFLQSRFSVKNTEAHSASAVRIPEEIAIRQRKQVWHRAKLMELLLLKKQIWYSFAEKFILRIWKKTTLLIRVCWNSMKVIRFTRHLPAKLLVFTKKSEWKIPAHLPAGIFLLTNNKTNGKILIN